MDARKEIASLLKNNNCKLLRSKKHIVYKLPNGNKFTLSKTPSDCRAYENALKDLRKGLGIKIERKIGHSRNKKPGVVRTVEVVASIARLPDWKEQLLGIKSAIPTPAVRIPWRKKVFVWIKRMLV